jgi:hypothetical protein
MQLVVLSEPAFKRLVETDAAAARECEAAMRERWASPISRPGSAQPLSRRGRG